MTFYDTQKGLTPTGEPKQQPIGGIKYTMTIPLAANGSTSTGWLENDGYGSLLYVIRADQPSATGGVVVEYSDDGINAIPGGGALTYSADQVNMQIQRSLVPKANYTRISYTNGAAAQGSFRLEVRQSTTLIQPTEGSLNVPMTNSALGMYVVADEQLTDGTSYDRIGRIGDAKKVHVVNQSSSTTDVSALAKDTTLTNGNQKTQVTNFPTAASSTVTTQTTLATVTTVLPANANRKGASFFSVSGTILIKLGSGATTTNFSVRLVTNAMYDLSFPYTGVVTAIGAGTLNVTEVF